MHSSIGKREIFKVVVAAKLTLQNWLKSGGEILPCSTACHLVIMNRWVGSQRVFAVQ